MNKHFELEAELETVRDQRDNILKTLDDLLAILENSDLDSEILKSVIYAVRNKSRDTHFKIHLESQTKEVKTWPKWKQDLI